MVAQTDGIKMQHADAAEIVERATASRKKLGMDQPILRIYACEGGNYLIRVGQSSESDALRDRLIVRDIPEVNMFREISLIWEILANEGQHAYPKPSMAKIPNSANPGDIAVRGV